MQAKSETIRRLLDLESRDAVRISALVQEPGSEFLAVDAEAELWPAASRPEIADAGDGASAALAEKQQDVSEVSGETAPFTVLTERLRDENYGAFAQTLQLPESKTPPLLQLDALRRPMTKTVINVAALDHRQLIPIYVERQLRSSSFVEINLAPNADARVLFVEVPDMAEGREAPEAADEGTEEAGGTDRSLPAVYLNMNLADGARLEVAAVHDFRRFDPETGEIRPAKKAKVAKLSRPSTELEDRPIYLYLGNVGRDATFKWLSVNLEESIHEYGVVRLMEQGASGQTYTASYVPPQQIQHYQVNIEHEAPYTDSVVQSHGVADENSEGRFIARGRIHKGANGTTCEQTSRYITLDDSSRAFVDPLLVIDEFDVKAGHAGSSGQIDKAALFYLQTRGIGQEQAERLITQGFLKPLIDHLALDQARQLALQILHNESGGDPLDTDAS